MNQLSAQMKLVAHRFHSLSKKTKRIVIGASATVLFCILSVGVYAAMNTSAPIETETMNNEHALQTENPTLVSNESSSLLLGTAISNETANVYPRRNGIVEDIYVDIGDTVTKGQVIARLLPQGVEGQGAAAIMEKKARKDQAVSELSTTESVAIETIETAERKIQEKETELMIAKRQQGDIMQEFTEIDDKRVQLQEQAFITAQQARQTTELILLGSNARVQDELDSSELLSDIGLLSSNSLDRVHFTAAYNDLLSSETSYLSSNQNTQSTLIHTLLDQADRTLSHATTLLQNTAASPKDPRGHTSFSFTELSNHIDSVAKKKDSVAKSKEKLRDIENRFASLQATEPEIYEAFLNGNTANLKSNKVHMLESQISSAYTSLDLTKANQEKMIENRKRQIDIAQASLSSEYASSGHREIRSPFSGTVSKRFIDVGQIVMPSNPAFELTDVPTSLAKTAKTEIRFGIPEDLQDALSVDDTVIFFLQGDDVTEYEAIVTRKSPQVDLETRTFTIQAKIPDELTIPHQSSVRIRLTDTSTPLFRVSSFAVKREEDLNIIWVLDPETEAPMKKVVSVQSEDGEFAEITGDISEESKIILDPPDLLPRKKESDTHSS